MMPNELEMAESYKELKSYRKVADKYSINRYYVEKVLGGSKYAIPCGGRNKIAIDDCFFATDTPESFYWAGFIAADGCIAGQNTLAIDIKDEGHLEKFKECISYAGRIKRYGDVFRFSADSQVIARDLGRFGITHRKSLTYAVPEWMLDHELVNHFVRGCFDGDGYISLSGQYRVPQMYLGFCGSISCVSFFSAALHRYCGLRDKMPSKTASIFRVEYGGNKIVQKIVDFLYNQSTSKTRLDRKYRIASSIVICAPKYSPVVGTNVVTGEETRFASLKEAQEKGFNRSCITDCCRGRQKTHMGLTWKYDDSI
jgi:hypothetical protein